MWNAVEMHMYNKAFEQQAEEQVHLNPTCSSHTHTHTRTHTPSQSLDNVLP